MRNKKAKINDHVIEAANKRMTMIRSRSGFTNSIEVSADGTRGELCLAWKDSINVTLQSFSKNHIDVLIKNEDGKECRFTGFYGAHCVSDRGIVEYLEKFGSSKGLSIDCWWGFQRNIIFI